MNAITADAATESDVQQIMQVAGTVTNFVVRLTGTAGASPKQYVFTVRKNGTNTALTVSITGTTQTTATDTVHSVSFAEGDLISVESAPTNTPTARAIKWGAMFTVP